MGDRNIPTAGRIPPHDLDAEAAVLSAMLLDRDALDRVVGILRPEQFYSEANRRICEAAIELTKQHKPVDIVSVAGELRDRDRLPQVGGAAYLAQLVDAVPSVANIETYAEMVREKWRVRTLIAKCHSAAAEGYGDVGEVQGFIERFASDVGELATSNAKGGFVQVGHSVQGEFERLSDAASRGERLTGLSTGFHRVDSKLGGLHDGDLTIVAARPGMGKTAWVLNIASNVVQRDVYPLQGVAVFSLEMPKEQLSMRLMCSEARVDLGKARQGFLNDRDWTELSAATARVLEWPLFILDTPAISLVEAGAEYRKLQRELDPKKIVLRLAVFDYLQLMRGDSKAGNREQEIAGLSRGLKQLAKELKVPIVALAQLNRATEARAAKDKRPQLADLRESGAIEQDADNVLFLYREDYYEADTDKKGVAEIIVAKQRNGPTGRTLCRFESAYTRFDNLAAGEHPDDEDNAA
jgi:replicative DNA helicase